MRTLLSTVVVGIAIAASPALAQQHPWVPSYIYTGSVQTATAPAYAAQPHHHPARARAVGVLAPQPVGSEGYYQPSGQEFPSVHPWCEEGYRGPFQCGQ